MAATTILQDGPVSVIDYRCNAGPGDRPFVEHHDRFTISYVRNGSFGCRTRGESFELVAGVLEDGEGTCKIVWIIDLLPHEMAGAVGAMAAQGVAAMKKTLGGR